MIVSWSLNVSQSSLPSSSMLAVEIPSGLASIQIGFLLRIEYHRCCSFRALHSPRDTLIRHASYVLFLLALRKRETSNPLNVASECASRFRALIGANPRASDQKRDRGRARYAARVNICAAADPIKFQTRQFLQSSLPNADPTTLASSDYPWFGFLPWIRRIVGSDPRSIADSLADGRISTE